MLPHRTLKLSPLLKIIFLCPALFEWVPLLCLLDHWFFLMLHLACCWTPLVYFSGVIIFFSSVTSAWSTFLYFLSLCWSFSLCSPILLPVNIFVTISLNSLSAKLFLLFHELFFPLRIYLVLLFRTYSFVSLFCLTFCVCFYVLGGKLPLPVLKEWPCIGDEPFCLTLPYLLIASQIFVII